VTQQFQRVVNATRSHIVRHDAEPACFFQVATDLLQAELQLSIEVVDHGLLFRLLYGSAGRTQNGLSAERFNNGGRIENFFVNWQPRNPEIPLIGPEILNKDSTPTIAILVTIRKSTLGHILSRMWSEFKGNAEHV
jgi:hypothetical protein